MTRFENTLDVTPDGTVLTAANLAGTGTAPGPVVGDLKSRVASAVHGSAGARATLTASLNSYAPWTVSGQQHSFRIYYTPDTVLANINKRLFRGTNAGTAVWELRHATSGAFDLLVVGAGTFPSTATSFPTAGNKYRLEGLVTATTARLVVYDWDGTTALHDQTVSSLTIGAIDEVRWGLMANAASTSTADIDTPAYDNNGALIGPYVSDTTAPSVPAGLHTTAVGATTADLAWTASTDDVAVAGYEILIVGP